MKKLIVIACLVLVFVTSIEAAEGEGAKKKKSKKPKKTKKVKNVQADDATATQNQQPHLPEYPENYDDYNDYEDSENENGASTREQVHISWWNLFQLESDGEVENVRAFWALIALRTDLMCASFNEGYQLWFLQNVNDCFLS